MIIENNSLWIIFKEFFSKNKNDFSSNGIFDYDVYSMLKVDIQNISVVKNKVSNSFSNKIIKETNNLLNGK